ncbi:MAG TPA: DUF5985 family protein [Thermoanaerobaculia bacterium]|nr:DUF5985 family protein [Thermoanaerobaculia bacterium]
MNGHGMVAGALLAGYAMVALFFLRFWVSSRDRLFALFALAFGVLAVQRLALALTRESMEDQTVFYLLRLAAFIIIIMAIVDKNRR